MDTESCDLWLTRVLGLLPVWKMSPRVSRSSKKIKKDLGGEVCKILKVSSEFQKVFFKHSEDQAQ